MLGNDVVDLQDADSRPETFRARFDERVFTPEERRTIAQDPSPLARRWAHWAAKEAAYKLAKQIDDEVVFAPGRLRIRFDGGRRGAGRRVERRGVVDALGRGRMAAIGPIELRSFENDDCVHVVALTAGADWGAVDLAVAPLEAPQADAGAAVRRLAVREIARSLGVGPERLKIDRRRATASAPGSGAPSRVPCVRLDGVETGLSLSLSHHGRFVAYAMTPRLALSGLAPAAGAARPRSATLGTYPR